MQAVKAKLTQKASLLGCEGGIEALREGLLRWQEEGEASTSEVGGMNSKELLGLAILQVYGSSAGFSEPSLGMGASALS